MHAQVLLVDDDPSVRKAMRKSMAGIGCRFLEASEGRRALAIARNEIPSAVVVDMSLKDGNAVPFLRTLKRDAGTNQIRVLALSGSQRLSDAEELFSLGADAYLSKPFGFDVLARKVQRLLDDRRQETDRGSPQRVPIELGEATRKLFKDARPLGDMAEIFGGVSPRHRTFRRYAWVGPEWTGVLEDNLVQSWRVEEPDVFYRFDRTGLLRLPDPREYDHAQKVVLKRIAPPVVAAVDTTRSPVSSSLYSIIPAAGLSCAYLTCLLNSRLMNYYFHRVRPLNCSYLRRNNITELPIRLASSSVQEEMVGISLGLARIGTVPSTPRERTLRSRLLREMNRQLFAVYGWTDDEIRLLTEHHF